MKYFKNKVVLAVAGVAITLILGGLYLVIQQSLRYAANEPQRSMAQDVARLMQDGKQPGDIVSGNINIATDMAPFLIVYNKAGKVVAGNGFLDNKIPEVPIGVLQATEGHKINSVTWQPAPRVRIASVSVQATDSYYVLGGRSLFTTEFNIKSLGDWLLGTWVVCMLALGAAYWFFVTRTSKQKP